MQESFSQQFVEFTQDVNVLGKPQKPDGTTVSGKTKTQMDSDGGGFLSYQGPLTYHDRAYDTQDKNARNAKGQPTGKTLPAAVSEHGGLDDSSELERKAYQENKKFEDNANATNANNPSQGISYEGMFKKTVVQVESKQNASTSASATGSSGASPAQNKYPVERWDLRPESSQVFKKVGEDTFEGGIARAARDPEKRNDSGVMGNLTFYYKAAEQATKAFIASTRANLAQGQINQLPSPVGQLEMFEDNETCEKAVDKAYKDKNSGPVSAADQKNREELLKMCKAVASMPASAVNPKYVEESTNSTGKTYKPQSGDPKDEDGRLRDWRIQYMTLTRKNADPNAYPSNWQGMYEEKDMKAPVTVSYSESDGSAAEVKELTVDEQKKLWDDSVAEAVENFDAIEQRSAYRFPDKKTIIKNAQIRDKSVAEINQVPASMLEELGVEKAPAYELPETYEQLLMKSK
ncbi:MAG: hypothetical protein HY537_14155 [Deltaproteobacteria bacterium]|nr:hypothetical protein [Deltaproteobacteria bacterium]